MATKIVTMVCQKCGEDASGPDADAVLDAMNRHIAKKHPKQKAATK